MTPVLLRTPNASVWDPRAVHLLLEETQPQRQQHDWQGWEEAISLANGGPCGTAVGPSHSTGGASSLMGTLFGKESALHQDSQ